MKTQPAFASLCRGPRLAGAEILLCLYEASCPICQGGNGPRDIVFMRMAPVIGCQPSATPVDRGKVFICEKVPPAYRHSVSSSLSSWFAEARFSHINTNQLYTANQGRGGVSANRGPRQSGAKPGYVFTHKQALRLRILMTLEHLGLNVHTSVNISVKFSEF